MGKHLWKVKTKVEPEIDILDFIDSNENSNLLDEMPSLPALTSHDISSVIPSFTSHINDFIPDNFFECNPKLETFSDSDNDSSKYQPRIIQVNNYQNSNELPSISNIKKEVDNSNEFQTQETQESEDQPEEIPYEIKYACEKSLFKSKLQSEKYPWEKDVESSNRENNDDFVGDKNIELMSEYDENEMYKRLKTVFDSSNNQEIEIPPWIRRHYRKLCVRKMQRSLGISVFNVDKFTKNIPKNTTESPNSNVLDRFHHLIAASGNFSSGSKVNDTFMSRLVGSSKYELFISPHTERVLHPFIYRNDLCVPPWVKMMCELQYEVNGTIPNRASIDYCYVRPQHIAAVNALLQRMFWPGIDSKYFDL